MISAVAVLAMLVLGGCSGNLKQNSGMSDPYFAGKPGSHTTPEAVAPTTPTKIIGPTYVPPRIPVAAASATANPPGGKF
ncbi:hypothetical protein [Candidatus Frankia alpina]|nr:hypothetical protein [Candidatus Frankia alpina]